MKIKLILLLVVILIICCTQKPNVSIIKKPCLLDSISIPCDVDTSEIRNLIQSVKINPDQIITSVSEIYNHNFPGKFKLHTRFISTLSDDGTGRELNIARIDGKWVIVYSTYWIE